MNLAWTHLALADLHHAYDFIAQNNVNAAKNVLAKIKESAHKLTSYPYLGRKGRVSDTRELIVPQTPFILIYRIKGTTLEIVAILHSARKWPACS